MDNPERRHHSFFWPVVLIGVGVIWLLVNLGIIASINVVSLLQFWPILLIIIGLDILFGRRAAWVGGLVGLLAVGGLVAYLILSSNAAVKTVQQPTQENFSAPIDKATSVNYNFETSYEPVEIFSLAGTSDQLIDANLTYSGTIDFSVTGTANKMVNLSEMTNPASWLNWSLPNSSQKWSIGLSPRVPAKISINGGSGSIKADLNGINLEFLSADLGSGAASLGLPAVASGLQVDINSGSGSVNLSLPANTNITLNLQIGSGAMNINLPDHAAVQVKVMDSGSGSLNLPAELKQISGDKNTGVWQSDGFDQASSRISIKVIDRGSGSISIQ